MADSVPSNDTANGANTDSRFLLQIRDQLFHIEVWMYNQVDDKTFKPFPIPTYFIEGLAIEESLMSWNQKGWIVLNNDFEVFERGALSTEYRLKAGSNTEYEGANQIPSPFTFRTDGRNKISLRIFPITKSDNSANISDLPSEQWEMRYDFVIYDIEDLKTNSAAKKLRKFYFWDERFQIFTERNIEWSSSLYGESNGNINAKDSERIMPVSEAIKSIIKTAASNTSDPRNSSDIKVGNTKGPEEIANPNIPLDNFNLENWDAGSNDSLIFYTSPANSCVLEDLQYVCQNLKASDGSCLFLLLDRYTKQWSLVPITKFFNEAAMNQIERLVIQDNQSPSQSSEGGSTPYMGRAPFDSNENSPIKNFQSNIASKILTYKFAPMVASDDVRITNAPVHNYDFSTNQYNVNFEENTAEKFLQNMKTFAGSNNSEGGLYSFKQSKTLLLNINQTKTSGLMASNNFISRRFFPKDISAVSMIKDFLFLNQALYFSAPGLTFRTPGKFVFIDRDASTGEKNPFDDRFLGQWMLIRVVHMFTKSEYVTDIVATKIDTFTPWWKELDKNNQEGNGGKY
jgi:hypothetical protein